jgi:uncharacterized protein (UPF0248 family)
MLNFEFGVEKIYWKSNQDIVDYGEKVELRGSYENYRQWTKDR